MEEVFKELPKMKYYYICKLCICNHGIKNDFIIQTNIKKQVTKLYDIKIIFTFRVYKMELQKRGRER